MFSMLKALWIVRDADHEAEARKTKEYAFYLKTHTIEFRRLNEHPIKPEESLEYIIIDEAVRL